VKKLGRFLAEVLLGLADVLVQTAKQYAHVEPSEPGRKSETIDASLHQFGHGSLPFMTTAHERPDDFVELDRLYETFLSNHVANRASCLQGKALLTSAERTQGPCRAVCCA